MDKYRVLDCTLRDGGWVNGFEFGEQGIQDIVRSLEVAGVEVVELGYLDENKGSLSGRSMYQDVEAIKRNGLDQRFRKDALQLVMIDYGKFPLEKLPDADGGSHGIDGIRYCFHKETAEQAVEIAREIAYKGYHILIQPMVNSRYSDDELKALIELVQDRIKPLTAFYIVDSFGVMDQELASHRVEIADKGLKEDIILGVHFHNNRNLAFENALAACHTVGKNRRVQVDCTIDGVGKGAGNLATEEFTAYLNRERGKTYNLKKLHHVDERQILPLKENHHWGSRPAYILTAQYGVTPTYADMFYWEKRVSLKELGYLLSHMPEEKKDSFDRAFAERYVKAMQDHLYGITPDTGED